MPPGVPHTADGALRRVRRDRRLLPAAGRGLSWRRRAERDRALPPCRRCLRVGPRRQGNGCEPHGSRRSSSPSARRGRNRAKSRPSLWSAFARPRLTRSAWRRFSLPHAPRYDGLHQGAVSETLGDERRFVHLGLTSSDVIDTALSLQVLKATDLLLRDLDALERAVTARAVEHRHTLMMGRTHGVHAEPMTFGLKLALWIDEDSALPSQADRRTPDHGSRENQRCCRHPRDGPARRRGLRLWPA